MEKRKHLKFIDTLPCCLCGRRAGITHHHLLRVDPSYLPIAEGEQDFLIPKVKSKGMGTKSDDRFTIPLCPRCHRAAHDAGNDKEFFIRNGISSPEEFALFLYEKTGNKKAACDIISWLLLGRGIREFF